MIFLGDSGASLGRGERNYIVDVLICALIIIISAIGFSPLSSTHGIDITAADGSNYRQFFYISLFSIILLRHAYNGTIPFVSSTPIVFFIFILLAVSSTFWSMTPEITLRRSALAGIVTVIVMEICHKMQIKSIVNLYVAVTTGLLVVCYISIGIYPTGSIHTGISGSEISGAWKGVFSHKNVAGPIICFSIIFLIYNESIKSRAVRLTLITPFLVFLIQTRSKTSIILLVACLIFDFILARGKYSPPAFLKLFSTLLILVGIISYCIGYDVIWMVLSDRNSFTGRGVIWQATLDIFKSQPIYGHGFGSIFGTGFSGPLMLIDSPDWLFNMAHGHNIYIETLGSLGFIGVSILLCAVVIYPLTIIFRISKCGKYAMARPFVAIWIFILLHNLLESNIFMRDEASWIALLISISSLIKISREPV